MNTKPSKRKSTKAPAKKRARVSSSTRIEKIVAGSESKYNDVTLTTDINTTGDIIQLSSIAQGTTNFTRDGNKIQYKSVDIRMMFTETFVVTAAQPSLIRVLLVIDRQSNGNAATFAELLSGAVITSHSNITAFGRFHVLLDDVITIDPNTMSNAGVIQQVYYHKFIKVPATAWSLVHYNQTTATIPYSNSLSLFLLGNIPNGGTGEPDMVGEARVKFIG